MESIWIEEKKLAKSLERNEAYWKGQVEDYPIMWITVLDAKPGTPPAEPDEEEKMWTDVDYAMASTEYQLSHTYYAGDSLPVYNPWLGPDQFAAGWLGAKIKLKPKDYTSWIEPFVDNWENYPKLEISPDNQLWKLYLETVRASVEAGKGKWVTAHPDLHTGIDGLAAIRGPEKLMMDMISTPDLIHKAMQQTTELWKYIVDVVSDIVVPAGQGTSSINNCWSKDRFMTIGQNDFSCLISPEMFVDFCWQDNLECCNHVDRSLYHLDGMDALRHLPKLLELENLTAIQWIQGAGKPFPSKWTDMLRKIQQAGKPVQLCYAPGHGGDADLFEEVEVLCNSLDTSKLFIWIMADSIEKADALVKHAKKVCKEKRNTKIAT